MIYSAIQNVIVKSKTLLLQSNFNLKEQDLKKLQIKKFERNQKARNSFLKPTKNSLTPGIGKVVGATSKNPQVG